MNQSRWFLHPIFVFIISILALGLSLFLFIYWYVKISLGLRGLVSMLKLESTQFFELETWVVIVVLSVLVGLILIGFFIIFAYHQKTFQLYRLQHNFINNFTHELKTPVTSLKLYLETFLKYDLNREERRKYLGYMVQDVSRLSDNISAILNLARIESKNYIAEFELLDIADFTDAFYRDNGHLFKGCEIRVRRLDRRSFHCRIDRSLLEMLLINMGTNALKYNRSEKPFMDVVFERSYRKLRVRFKDNGIGLKKGECGKIFKKFYQAGSSDNMTARGSGLGLYLVWHIAKIHKGGITAKSGGEGSGSEFILTLPPVPGIREVAGRENSEPHKE